MYYKTKDRLLSINPLTAEPLFTFFVGVNFNFEIRLLTIEINVNAISSILLCSKFYPLSKILRAFFMISPVEALSRLQTRPIK